MTGDTNEIKRSMVKIQEDIRERERIVRDRPAKRMIWSGWIFAGLAFAAGIAIIMWILDQPQMVHMRETINPLVLCVGVAGVLVAAAGHVLLYLRRGQDAQRADWEEVTKGLDLAVIGRLAAQLQGIETLLPAYRAQSELDRSALVNKIDGMEKGIVERLLLAIEKYVATAVEDAMKKAHAAGFVAGVQQRLNGSGGSVVPLHKS